MVDKGVNGLHFVAYRGCSGNVSGATVCRKLMYSSEWNRVISSAVALPGLCFF